MRVESGTIQFGDDWPGIVLRGDHAFFFLKVCEALEAKNPMAQNGLNELKEILASCHQNAAGLPKIRNKLCEFSKCTENSTKDNDQGEK